MWVMWVKILGKMERIARGLEDRAASVSTIFIESSGTHKLDGDKIQYKSVYGWVNRT